MATATISASPLTPNMEFSHPVNSEQVEATAEALRANGMETIIVPDGAAARDLVLSMLPEGAEVFTAGSRTLDNIGLAAAINESGNFQAIRPRIAVLDRATQGREMRKLAASPDYVVGSVHAITAQGQVLIASYGGSQLASYVYGASKVIWVVGTQKLVTTLEEGLRRIQEYSLPLEDARLRATMGRPSHVGKILQVNEEAIPNRVTVVLVEEELGF